MSEIDPVTPLLMAAVAGQRRALPGLPLLRLAESFVELGLPSLTAQVALDEERERTNPHLALWFSELALLHGKSGRRDDVERLAQKAEAARVGTDPEVLLAIAFEWLGDEARASSYLYRLPVLERIGPRARMVEIALGRQRMTRAEALLADPDLKRGVRDPQLRLDVARGYIAAGDIESAKKWADLALELMREPSDYRNLEIAIVVGQVGDAARALQLARAYDRTLEKENPYMDPSARKLALAYAAGGKREKAELIVDAHALSFGWSVSGKVAAISDYAALGLTRGRVRDKKGRYPFEKILTFAEQQFRDQESNVRDMDRDSLALGQARFGSLARAIDHALAIEKLDNRADILVAIAERVHGRSFEETPELLDALAKLDKSSEPTAHGRA